MLQATKKIVLLGSTGSLGGDVKKVLSNLKDIDLFCQPRSELDLANPDQITKKLGELNFDFLINCAAYNNVEEAEICQKQAFDINAEAVAHLARACFLKKSFLIHISTDYVFDGIKTEAYTESDTCFPIQVYGASKFEGEKQALKYNPHTYVLRVASLFGTAVSRKKGGSFAEKILALACDKKQISVVNDLVMSPTYTWDVACMIGALIQKTPDSGVYHAVNSGQATWYEFAREIVSLKNLKTEVTPVPSSFFPSKVKRPVFSVLNNKKISELNGPVPDWREGLRRCFL